MTSTIAAQALSTGTDTRVSREEAGRMLGLSVAEVRRKEKLGAFSVVGKGPHGKVYYARKAVAEYARRNGKTPIEEIEVFAPFTAEEASLVFIELEKGSSLIQCAMTCTNVHPSKIRAIAVEYERLSGSILLSSRTVAAINDLPLDGTFPITKESDVLSLLTESGNGAPCAICSKSPRHMCKTCAIPFVRRQLQREARAEKKTAVDAEALTADD